MFRQLISAFIFVGGVFCFLLSCDKEPDIPARFSIDTVSIDVISTGQLSSGEVPTISIVANKGYNVTSDSEWLTVDKPQGSGSATVTVLAAEYTQGQSRTGHLTVSSADFSQVITVRQTNDPFPAFGYIYFQDDFSWITPYAEALGAGDYIATADPGASAPNVGSKAEAGDVDAVAFMAEFDERGYAVLKPEDNTMYLMTHYLKFCRTDYNNGLILPAIDFSETGETSSNVQLTFDFAGHMSGKLYVDDIRMVVEVMSGDGQIETSSGTMSDISDAFTPSQKDGEAKWTSASVNIYGISSNTELVIRHENLDATGVHRFHLDNIRMVKIPAKQ